MSGLKINSTVVKTGDITVQAKPSSTTAAKTTTNIANEPQFASNVLIPSQNKNLIKAGPDNFDNNFIVSTQIVGKSPNENFDILASLGVNRFRPEIIALTNFLPAYSDKKDSKTFIEFEGVFSNELSTSGKMLKIQLWARKLLTDDMLELISSLKDTKQISKLITEREKKFIDEIDIARSDIEFLFDILNNLEKLKSKLNIRTSENIKDILISDLGFTENNFEFFSNTKIFLQLLYDFQQIASKHSYTLLTNVIPNRLTDESPFQINKQLPFNIFHLKDFSSNKITTNSILLANHKKFSDALPTETDDRIKLLCVLLSREIRTSAVLGNIDSNAESIRAKILSDFPNVGTVGDPYPNIFGTIGSFITDINANNSITDVANILITDGNVVLPFENKILFHDQKTTKYIPGSSYFIDSVLSGKNKFDLTFLSDYVNDLNKKTTTFVDAMTHFTNPSDNSVQVSIGPNLPNGGSSNASKISINSLPRNIFLEILNTIKVSLHDLVSTEVWSQKHAFFVALFDAASKDIQLKNLVLKYIIRIILVRGDNGDVGQFYENLVASEPEFLVPGALSTLPELSTAIANRLQELYTLNTKTSTNGSTFTINNKASATTQKEVKYSLQQVLSLLSAALVQDSNSSNSIIYNDMPIVGNIIQYLDKFETLNKNYGVRLDDGTKRTRKSFLSVSTTAVMIFEMFVSATSLLTFSKFATIDNTGNFVMVFDTIENQKIITTIDFISATSLVVSSGVPQNPIPIVILHKLQDDDTVIKNILSAITNFNSAIQQIYKKVSSHIIADPKSPYGKKLEEIKQIINSDELLSEVRSSQIVLSRAYLDDHYQSIAQQNNESYFIDNDSLNPGMENGLFSMLKEPFFSGETANNLKIISVGIPTGFIDSLNKELNIDNIKKHDLIAKQQDFIYINVYKIDQQYDDIIFKPKRFLFELSRFVSRTQNPKFSPGISFNEILKHLQTKDFSFFLENSNDENIQETIVKNHVISFFLESYIRSMTGISITEKEFVINANDLLEKKFQDSFIKNVVESYFSSITGTTIKIDDITNKNIFTADINKQLSYSNIEGIEPLLNLKNTSKSIKTKLTQDLKTFVRLFLSRSLISDGKVERARIVSPSIFERIFHVPVDSDDFEIDIDLTNETENGKKCLLNLLNENLLDTSELTGKNSKNLISSDGGSGTQLKLSPVKQQDVGKSFSSTNVSVKLKPRKSDNGKTVLEKYFITIETIE